VHEWDGFGIGDAALMTVNTVEPQSDHDKESDHHTGKQLPEPGLPCLLSMFIVIVFVHEWF
jgi:hypothetical protein